MCPNERKMRYVLLQYHGLELLISVACAVIYIVGLEHGNQTYSYKCYFCFLYMMFIILNLITILDLFYGLPISIGQEAIISLLASIGFIVTSFWSMIKSYDDPDHYYFMMMQGIFSLAAGFLYLLHSMLCLDVYMAIEKLHGAPPPSPSPQDEFTEPDKDHYPTELYLLHFAEPFADFRRNTFPKLYKYVDVKEEPHYIEA